ncbi:MAG: hypothetical protein ABEK59_03940 [Halobacteria archaeon]
MIEIDFGLGRELESTTIQDFTNVELDGNYDVYHLTDEEPSGFWYSESNENTLLGNQLKTGDLDAMILDLNDKGVRKPCYLVGTMVYVQKSNGSRDSVFVGFCVKNRFVREGTTSDGEIRLVSRDGESGLFTVEQIKEFNKMFGRTLNQVDSIPMNKTTYS